MKETAVEWLVEELKGVYESDYLNKLIEQAKAMEKEQIVKAFDEGQEYEYQYHINSAPKFDSETYYKETYESKTNI
jgi:hypothetical protein